MNDGIILPRVRIRPGAKKPYELLEQVVWRSQRYNRTVTVEPGFRSDGASGPARDILSRAWIVHDKVCTTFRWDDGSPISVWQTSVILNDALAEEGHTFIGPCWGVATYFGIGSRFAWKWVKSFFGPLFGK